jgi:hypothetical protein
VSTVDWLRRLRAAGASEELAEAIAGGAEERTVSRDYLDSRLRELEHRLTDALTVRMLGIAGLLIVAIGAIDKWVRP